MYNGETTNAQCARGDGARDSPGGAELEVYQRGQWEELQRDTDALQRWTSVGGNTRRSCNEAKKARSKRLLANVDKRWGPFWSENGDTRKKPLLIYEERMVLGRPSGEKTEYAARWEVRRAKAE